MTSPPAFSLPAALASQGFSLRPETEEDIPFLTALFRTTREAEMEPLPWSDEQKAGFVAMQFNAQRSFYRANMPEAEWLVVLHDGAPVGRLYLDWRDGAVNLMDITLVPGYRGRGLGTALLAQLLAIADSLDQAIVLFVERFNPAYRLYRRFGFVEVADGDVYQEMRREAGAPMGAGVS